MLDHTPHFLLYNRSLNPWGRDREVPEIPEQSFRQWYVVNRKVEMSNTSREQILSAIRANIPPGRVEHPQIPVFKRADTNLKTTFEKHLPDAGGVAHNIESGTGAQAKLAALHSAAQVICSAVPEIPGTRRAETVRESPRTGECRRQSD